MHTCALCPIDDCEDKEGDHTPQLYGTHVSPMSTSPMSHTHYYTLHGFIKIYLQRVIQVLHPDHGTLR